MPLTPASRFGPVVLAVLTILWAGLASACSCSQPGAPLEELASARAVFLGEVVATRDSFAVDSAISKNGEMAGHDWGTFVTIRVSKWWKWRGLRLSDASSRAAIQSATADTLVTVLTSGDGASCGYAFRVGERYVVYGHEVWGRFEPWKDQVAGRVSLCSRTRPLRTWRDDVFALGVDRMDVAWMKEMVELRPLSDLLLEDPNEVLADTSLAFHTALGVWFMQLNVHCDQEHGMEAKILDPDGKLLCPLHVANPGATAVANRCDCFAIAMGPREGARGWSAVGAEAWKPKRGRYRIRAKGLEPCTIKVTAGASFSMRTYSLQSDSVSVVPGQECEWSVQWVDPSPGDSSMTRLERTGRGR